MANITITFDGATPDEDAIARTNTHNLNAGDIIEYPPDHRYRVIGQATYYDYLAQCQENGIDVDLDKLIEDREKLWFVEVLE